MFINIKDKLYKDILSYCELNDLDAEDYVNKLLQKNFNIDKYGEKPLLSHTDVKEQETVVNEIIPVQPTEVPQIIISSETSNNNDVEVSDEPQKKITKRKLSK